MKSVKTILSFLTSDTSCKEGMFTLQVKTKRQIHVERYEEKNNLKDPAMNKQRHRKR